LVGPFITASATPKDNGGLYGADGGKVVQRNRKTNLLEKGNTITYLGIENACERPLLMRFYHIPWQVSSLHVL
jgi:hypothetical protein